MHLPDEWGMGLIDLKLKHVLLVVYIKNKIGSSRTGNLVNKIYSEGEKKGLKTKLFLKV